jgi:hypothetical protein
MTLFRLKKERTSNFLYSFRIPLLATLNNPQMETVLYPAYFALNQVTNDRVTVIFPEDDPVRKG